MKSAITIIVLLFVVFGSKAQSDTIEQHNAYGVWFLPAKRANVYGLSLGLFGNEALCYVPFEKNTHGVNIQLGQGFFSVLAPLQMRFPENGNPDSVFSYRANENYIRAKHNGLLISALGTWTPVTNGISISGLASTGGKMNGLTFNPILSQYASLNGVSVALINISLRTRGIQVGLINKTRELKGFQFGLWNVNRKRSLPFVNWCFR